MKRIFDKRFDIGASLGTASAAAPGSGGNLLSMSSKT